MAEKLKEISEKTLVPLGLVGTIVMIAIWVNGISSDAKEARSVADECAKDFKVIDERLSRIEGRLDINKGE